MDFNDIPSKALRRLNMIFMHDEYLHKREDVQQKILDWATVMLVEARKEWEDYRATTIEAVIKCDRSAEGKRKMEIRDKKYAPFRAYFRELQKKKYDEALENGRKLTANGFVVWFLENKDADIEIPYVKQNQKNKLIQLAQKNNLEFR